MMGAICSLNVTVCAGLRTDVAPNTKSALRCRSKFGESPDSGPRSGATVDEFIPPEEGRSGSPAAEQFLFGAVPIFLGRAVLPAASLPVGIGKAGNLLMRRRGNGDGWALVEFAARAAGMSSCAGMGH